MPSNLIVAPGSEKLVSASVILPDMIPFFYALTIWFDANASIINNTIFFIFFLV